jgi:hypothetical protein
MHTEYIKTDSCSQGVRHVYAEYAVPPNLFVAS